MWQANGRSDVEDYDSRIALDLYYIRNWSLWLDVIITVKTIKNVIIGRVHIDGTRKLKVAVVHDWLVNMVERRE